MIKILGQFLDTGKKNKFNLVLTIVFISLLPLIFFGSSTPYTSQSIPGNIDSWFNLYILEHGYQNFISSTGLVFRFNDWLNPDFFFPIRRVLPWSDNWLILGAPYNVFRAFFNPIISFKLVLFLSLVANYFSLRKFVSLGSSNNLIINGTSILFLCSFTVLARIGHAQLTPQFFGLLSLYYLVLVFSAKPQEAQVLPGHSLYKSVFFLIFQVITSFYIGIFYVVIWTLLLLSLRCLRFRDQFEYRPVKIRLLLPKLLTPSKAISLLSLISLLIFSYVPYYLRAKEKGLRNWDAVYDSLIQIPTLFYSKVGGIFTENLSPLSIDSFGSNKIPWEHSGYPGFVQFSFLFLGFSFLIISLIRRKKFLHREAILASIGVSVILMVIVSSKFTIFGQNIDPWFLLWKYLPGFGAIRVVTRCTSVLVLVTAPISAYAFERVLNIFKRKQQIIFTTFVLIIALTTSIPMNRDFESTSNFFDRVEKLSYKVSADDCSVFFNQAQPGVVHDPFRSQLVGMWASLHTKVPTVSGYSGDFPVLWYPYMSKDEVSDFINNRSFDKSLEIKLCFYTNN